MLVYGLSLNIHKIPLWYIVVAYHLPLEIPQNAL